jgi:hypothetical protein
LSVSISHLFFTWITWNCLHMYCNIEIYNLGLKIFWELKNVMFDYLVFIFSFSSLVETIFIFDSNNMVLFLYLFFVFSHWIDTTHESPTCNLDLYIYIYIFGQFRPLYKFRTCVQIVWIYWFVKNKVETFYCSKCF